ncbi:hypothetical protein [Nostoc sp.]
MNQLCCRVEIPNPRQNDQLYEWRPLVELIGRQLLQYPHHDQMARL